MRDNVKRDKHFDSIRKLGQSMSQQKQTNIKQSIQYLRYHKTSYTKPRFKKSIKPFEKQLYLTSRTALKQPASGWLRQ